MRFAPCCVLLSCLAAVFAYAEPPVADPMRPAQAAAAPAETAPRAAAAAEAAPPVWPQLQAVQVGGGYATTALIDGRLVRVGDKIGALTLVAIDPEGVLLRGPRFEQRLSLLPGVTKTASAAPLSDAPVLAAKESR